MNSPDEMEKFKQWMARFWGGVLVAWLDDPEEFQGNVQIAWEAWVFRGLSEAAQQAVLEATDA